MNSYSIIIQGEGRGHFSQAMALLEKLQSRGTRVDRIYFGRSPLKSSPRYFDEDLTVPLVIYFSPGFINTSDRRGIRVILSVLLNLLLAPVYLFESARIGLRMLLDKSEKIVNFYEPLAALSCRFWRHKA